MNILFIGSSTELSLAPLYALINSNSHLCTIATDNKNESKFSTIISGSIQSVALKKSLSLININTVESDVIAEIKLLQPDIILVSCYPKLISQSILSLAKFGAFNLHPSLLPQFRGPAPLFWQFHDGVSDFGVTLHRMSSHFDAGNIVLQESLIIPDGIHINDAINLVANCGARLTLDLIDLLGEHNLKEIAQDESLSHYQSFPTQNDYRVFVSWTAKRIYNFVCAYKEENVFFLCEIDGVDYKLIAALSYQNNVYESIRSKKYSIEGDVIMFACCDGYIKCQIKQS